MVQWDRVRLKQREAEGHFTFQAALHRNGTIVFSYRDVSTSYFFFSSSVFFFCGGGGGGGTWRDPDLVLFRSRCRWPR